MKKQEILKNNASTHEFNPKHNSTMIYTVAHKNVLCKKLDTKLYVLCVNILRRLFQNHGVTQDVGGEMTVQCKSS